MPIVRACEVFRNAVNLNVTARSRPEEDVWKFEEYICLRVVLFTELLGTSHS